MQFNRPPDRRPMSAANKLAIFVIVLVIFAAGAISLFMSGRLRAPEPSASAEPTNAPSIIDIGAGQQQPGAAAGIDAATPEPEPAPTVLVTPEPVVTAEPNFYMTPAPTEVPTLKLNSNGDDVKSMQRRLIELGYLKKDGDDGSFGKGTQNAVKAFQAANGLNSDGAAGPKTLTVLFSDDAKAKPD